MQNGTDYQTLVQVFPPSVNEKVANLVSVMSDIAGAKMRAMMVIGIIHGLRLAGLSAVEVSEKLGKPHW